MSYRPYPAISWDPLNPDVIADPFPIYKKLRTESPIFWHEGMNAWVLTRYADCKSMLHHSEIYARDKRRIGIDIPPDHMQIQFQDPPESRELRRILMHSLVEMDLPTITQECAHDLLIMALEYSDSAQLDLMNDIAKPIALELTEHIMGVKEIEFDYHAQVFSGLSRGMDRNLESRREQDGKKAGRQLADAMSKWYLEATGNGLLARVKEATKSLELPVPYVQNTLSAVFNAAYTDLFAATGSVILTLMQHPEAVSGIQRISTESELRLAANEFIRFISPAQGISRFAVTETKLGGFTIERGEQVVALLASANRDPEQFDEPDQLVLNRDPNAHLGFGYGPHTCAGAELARIWIVAVLNMYRAGEFHLVQTSTEHYQRTATLRCLESLPVAVRLGTN